MTTDGSGRGQAQASAWSPVAVRIYAISCGKSGHVVIMGRAIGMHRSTEGYTSAPQGRNSPLKLQKQ